MITDTKVKQQIYQMIESLPTQRLPNLLPFLKDLVQPDKSGLPPIYQVHQHAIDTGIPDLAAQHDHYLYSLSKDDA